MKRALWFGLLAVGSFFATLMLRGSEPAARPELRAPEGSAARSADPVAGRSVASDEGVGAPAAPRTVTIGSVVQSEYETALERHPHEATTMRNALYKRTSANEAERGVRVQDCLEDADAPLAQKLRFSTHVESDGQQIRSTAWRFVEVIDGTELEPGVVECFEQALGGPYVIDAMPGETFLDDFAGEIELIWRGS